MCLFITAMCACVFSVALGLVVVVGWYIHNETLVQVIPTFVPMQYNTALGFLLCGAGISLAIFKKHYSVAILGSLPIVIGGLTLFEYSMGMNLGIDELFMKHTITVKTSHPGRMAPNTATCFVLIGSVLVFQFFLRKRIYKYQLEFIFASLALGLGIVALSGYMTHLESAYGWGNLTRMAVHTSIGFIALGVGALALFWRDDLTNEIMIPRWLAVPTAIGTITVTICFWQALQSEYALIARQSDVSVLAGLSRLSYAILISGVLLAIALALAVYYAQISNRHAEGIIKANRNLKDEITERKKSEKSLQESESKLQSIMSSLYEAAIVVFDRDGKITELWGTPEMDKRYGVRAADVVGKSLKDIHPPEQAEKKITQIKHVFDTGNKQIIEEIVTLPGGDFWHEISLSPMRDTKGNITAVVGSIHDITERIKFEEDIKGLAKFPSENPNPVLRIEHNGTVIFANSASSVFLDYWDIQTGQSVPEDWYNHVLDVIRFGKSKNYEIECNDQTFSITLAPIAEEGYVNFYGFDITERKRAEEQINASLKEKEVLLKEIHHRVKNNMQIMASLLRLQSEGIKDKHLLDLFNESHNRIKSMALIHEDLYSGKDLARIDFDQYTRKLTGRLIKSLGVDPNRIITNVNIDNVFLGVDTAIPCGLIINELFTNSLKYAFPLDKLKDKKGGIRIDCHSNSTEHTLVFSDNGVGLPEDIDFHKTDTLGLELVRTLVNQLKGTIELNRNNGTEFKITFRV